MFPEMVYYNQKEDRSPREKEIIKMLDYRHSAYNVNTGEIINCTGGQQLKRAVAETQKVDRELYGVRGQWRFSHDYGQKWDKQGLPVR